ncbi:unnamed protein product [Heligmosomoides polygyrus]|uniref:CACTA en-spm transposon protein n=1 Tax=Heligmosomoides polygyrus TaxID=6339 RepID=A0A183G1P1_HELPZ|nr:unnamed protein product [Heligmosomoides polygyrus]
MYNAGEESEKRGERGQHIKRERHLHGKSRVDQYSQVPEFMRKFVAYHRNRRDNNKLARVDGDTYSDAVDEVVYPIE